MRKYLLVLIAATALATSCKRKKEPIVFSNDADQTIGWVNYHTVKADANAHSGGYVSLTDTVNQYSLTLKQKLSDVTKTGADKASVHVWVKPMGASPKACLIVSVDAPDKNYMWQCLPVESIAKEANKWTEIAYKVKLPADAPENAHVSVYIWNTSKEQLLIDDMEVRFEN
jgi:hypothetical protein